MSEQDKRKRRSFWEPDSPSVKAWLDAQTELGTSLQLIIVDAIRKYGQGDVIKAHLNQREDIVISGEQRSGVTEFLLTPPVQHMDVQTAQAPPLQATEAHTAHESTPPPSDMGARTDGVKPVPPTSPLVDVGNAATKVYPKPPVPQPPAQPVEPTVQGEQHDQNGSQGDYDPVDQLMRDAQTPQTETAEQPAYDPIKIMMQDADSRFAK